MDGTRRWTLLLAGLIAIQVGVIGGLVLGQGGDGGSDVFVEMPNLSHTQVAAENTSMELEHFFLPVRGAERKVFDSERFGYAIYHFNEDGLRERYEYSRTKPENVTRISFYGDSFIWGEYVNNSQLWTELLEDRLNQIGCSDRMQVINQGVNAYDVPYTVEYYRQRGQHYNNDVNIFIMKDDDIMEAMEILKPIIEKHRAAYRNRTGQERVPAPPHQAYYDTLNAALEEYRAKIASYNKTKLYQQQVYTPMNVLGRTVDEDAENIVFTALVNDEHNQVYRTAAKENGLRFFSLDSIGDAYGYGGMWGRFSYPEYNDPHPNPLGHRFIADVFYVYLVSNDLIDCGTDAFS